MSETRFTPSPWLMEPSNGDSYEIAPPNDSGKPDWSREIACVISGAADAHLVAAAPELYAALRNLLGSILDALPEAISELDGPAAFNVQVCMGLASEALAKARGEVPS